MARGWAWAAFLGVSAPVAAAYAGAGTQLGEELWWQVVTFSSAGALLAGPAVHRVHERRPWRILFASLAMFAVMGLLGASFWGWPAEHVIWHARDLGLVAGFVLLGVGTMALVRRRSPDGDPEGAIDGLIVMIAVAAVLWDTVFAPIVGRGSTDPAEVIRFVLFPVLQAAVLVAALRLLFLGTVRFTSAWMIFCAAGLACAANVLWVLQGGGPPGLAVNLLWIGSFQLAGAAALHPTMRLLAARAPGDGAQLSFGRLVVLGAALMSLPVVVVRHAWEGPAAVPVSAAAVVLCVGLVLWRIGRLVQQRERALAALDRRARREAALAIISGRALLASEPRNAFTEAAAEVARVLDAAWCEVLPGPVHPEGAVDGERIVDPVGELGHRFGRVGGLVEGHPTARSG